MTEIWKPIDGYEGLYEVSNCGRVKSLCATRWHKIKMRKPVPDKDGYLTVLLKRDGKYRCFKIHRLVATAFIPNTHHYPAVNHKDEDRQNNRVDNLEWCTAKYNNTYNHKERKCFKAVVQIDENGMIVGRYQSVGSAAAAAGVNPASISGVLSGRRNKTGGYSWAYQF